MIQRLHHPVAVRPRIRTKFIVLEAIALAEADNVEPVPRPTNAMARRIQVAIDEFFIGPGIAVGRYPLRPLDMAAAYSSPLGVVAIAAGLVLDGLAFLWIRKLVRVVA